MDQALMGRKTGWFADRGIISVNLILILSLISSYATGYDGSMMSMRLVTSLNVDERLISLQTDCSLWTNGTNSSINLVPAPLACTPFLHSKVDNMLMGQG